MNVYINRKIFLEPNRAFTAARERMYAFILYIRYAFSLSAQTHSTHIHSTYIHRREHITDVLLMFHFPMDKENASFFFYIEIWGPQTKETKTERDGYSDYLIVPSKIRFKHK